MIPVTKVIIFNLFTFYILLNKGLTVLSNKIGFMVPFDRIELPYPHYKCGVLPLN